jgi:hypothetical protein
MHGGAAEGKKSLLGACWLRTLMADDRAVDSDGHASVWCLWGEAASPNALQLLLKDGERNRSSHGRRVVPPRHRLIEAAFGDGVAWSAV